MNTLYTVNGILIWQMYCTWGSMWLSRLGCWACDWMIASWNSRLSRLGCWACDWMIASLNPRLSRVLWLLGPWTGPLPPIAPRYFALYSIIAHCFSDVICPNVDPSRFKGDMLVSCHSGIFCDSQDWFTLCFRNK